MMQKELGRYLFPVFLEKRESKRHLKNTLTSYYGNSDSKIR